MGDRDIPSVPITTLAGLTSLSDMLSELPISDSLSTVSTALNRSLLFHPRVAEEANNLLATRDDSLIGQLVNAIEQTNSDHIELKDQYVQQSTSKSLQEGPLLLQAIRSCRADVFNRPQTAHQQQQNQQQQQQMLVQQQQKIKNSQQQQQIFQHQQQQQQQLLHQQQQQQQHQQYHNQNVIVTHQSVIQNQQPQFHQQQPQLPSQQQQQQQQQQKAVDPHRSVIQQPVAAAAAGSSLNALPESIVLQHQQQQQLVNHVAQQQPQQQQAIYHQQQAVTQQQQPHQNVINMNNISNSASPTVQHQQQITTNHVQSPQQQRTPSAASKQQSHPAVNDQSQLKNGSTPTLQNHQPYPRSQFPTQQTPQPQQHSINHIIKTPEATPRNSEYLQQQQSKNLDARGRPSPAQGTTAPETDPTQTNLRKQQEHQQAQAVTPPVQRINQPTPMATPPNKPRPPGGVPPGGTPTSTPPGPRPISVAGALQRAGMNAAPKPILTTPVTSIAVSGALMKTPTTTTTAPTTPSNSSQQQTPQPQTPQQPPTPNKTPMKKPQRVNLKKLCRMITVAEIDTLNLKKCSVRLEKLSDEHMTLMQEDLKKFSQAEPKLAMRLGLVKKSAEMIFSKMKEDERRYTGLLAKRKAQEDAMNPEDMFSKPKLRKVEKMVVPVVKKLSKEELMNTNTYQRFMSIMGKIFDQLDETEAPNLDDGDEQFECIPTSMLSSISSEAAKLKARNAIDAIPENKLTLLITYAMRSVHSAKNLSGTELQDDLVGDECIEKILNAMEAALLICSIYTCKSTKFLQEDNVDAIIKFVQFQLRETVFPSYDPVYSVETKKKTDGKKSKKMPTYQQKGLSVLYTKIVELGKQLVTMFEKFHFVDTIVIHASALGVEPFFVDNIETLQFVCLDLVTSIFQNEKYSHHRRNIVADILSSIDRLPHSKRNLRPYKLVNNAGNIQMMTALVLQLIQCAVVLPEALGDSNPKKANNEIVNSSNPKSADLYIIGKYDTALSIGGNFLATFLDKCKSRSSETDFRPLFENFIHDLLTTVNKPEWPASELLLSLLGTMLVKKMSDKGVEQSIRVVSLEYLGIVAARLRKDTVESRCKVRTMDSLIKYIKIEQEKEGDEYLKDSKFQLDEEEERTEFLEKILLDFLAANAQEGNIVWNHARHFYITQWYRDIIQRKKNIAAGEKGYASRKKQAKRRKKYTSESENSDGGGIDSDIEQVKTGVDQELNSEIFRLLDTRKATYLSQVCPFGGKNAGISEIKTYIDYGNANLIAQYLASKRSFSQSFDKYLQKIILVVREPVVAIRTRAMKCLGNIVEVDQMVLARKDMQMGVHQKLLDTAISVREAAVDLVGKYILSDPDLIDQYYDMISTRILDTGVSVRKRVIKILRDICIEYPEQEKIPDICVKMIRRVNDEEGIQKLVMDVFMTMWFNPCNPNDKAAMDRKITQIIDVVCSSHETGTQGFDALLKSIFEPKENKEDSKAKKEIPKTLIKACQQIVDGLVDATMKLESSENKKLVGCITALHLFSKIQPQLLVNHAMTLEPYLNIRCQNAINYKFISSVAEILEQVVPLMEHPSEIFLADLESHLMMLIVTQSQAVVLSCVSCLSAVVNKITKNYTLIRDCFSKFYYKGLVSSKEKLISDPSIPIEQLYRPQFRRSIYTVGLIMRYFDFKQPEVYGGEDDAQGALPANICEDVYSTLAFFLSCSHSEICKETLLSMGNFCVKNYEYLTKQELRDYYNYLLTQDTVLTEMKIVVLKNILMYLTEEENKMVRNDKEWAKQAQTEDLKEMGDVSSGMASRVIQIYLKEILRSFLHRDTGVRMWAMRVVEIVLRQGLVHPVQIVPFLICLSTDPEREVAHSADRHLQEIDKQYPGFVNMKSHAGLQYSYELQVLLQKLDDSSIVRGYRIKDPQEPPSALNGFLYTLLRNTKPQRRALVQSITKQFDDGKISLQQMLYLADNLAYFPYMVQDEPLYIIHHIDVLISVTGTNLLATFREGLKPPPGAENNPDQQPNPLEDDDDDDQDVILSRLPEDTTELQNCITSAQGCMLLLILKQHLKDIYGITDCKISRYSPSEAGKIYDKTMQRRSNSLFDPKATITLLKENRHIMAVQSDDDRAELVQRYLDFKQLMLRLDPDDPDLLDEDDRAAPPKNSEPNSTVTTPVKQGDANSANPGGDSAAATPVSNNVGSSGAHVNNVNSTATSASSNTTAAVGTRTPKSSSRPSATNNAASSRKTLPSRSARKKRRKLSSSEEEESEPSDMDYD